MKKNMFFLSSARSRTVPTAQHDSLKYCAVPLQSNIYDINYQRFLPLLKRFSDGSPLIRCVMESDIMEFAKLSLFICYLIGYYRMACETVSH